MLAKRRLYLDTKFWNDFCDAELGESVNPHVHPALQRVREACREGSLVCPAEYQVLNEVLRQRSPEKRKATAALIDELSGGVILVPSYERVFLEVLRFAQGSTVGSPPDSPPVSEVWTRPAFVVGHITPDSDGIPPEIYAWAAERTFDALWDLSFSDIVRELALDPTESKQTGICVDDINVAIRSPENQIPRLRGLYLAEIAGALDAFEESLADVGMYLYDRSGGNVDEVAPSERAEATTGWKQLILAAFRQRPDLMASLLPTFHILATCHGRVRWDKQRRFRPNDLSDFGHAAAALPYCDCFATERSLSALLRQAGLQEMYQTRIVANCQQLIEWLDGT
jgi:hypothetical protein